GFEVSSAVATSQGDGFDLLATSGALLGIPPGRTWGFSRSSFFSCRRVFTTVGRAATNLVPAFAMMHLVATWTDEYGFARACRRLTNRAETALRPGIGQACCDNAALTG